MTYVCPVCGYPDLADPPVDMSYEICPSCGTEFGYTDFSRSHFELMLDWLRTGPRWHAEWMPPPVGWNPRRQLLEHIAPSVRNQSGKALWVTTTVDLWRDAATESHSANTVGRLMVV